MSEATLIPSILDLPTVESVDFKKVGMKHRRIVALHLQGHTGIDIDGILQYPPGYSSSVLRNPKIKDLLSRFYQDFDIELQGLIPGAIDAIRRNQTCGNPPDELRAADISFKASGHYDKQEAAASTAEDVIERMLEIATKEGSTIRYAERRRPFLGAPKDEV